MPAGRPRTGQKPTSNFRLPDSTKQEILEIQDARLWTKTTVLIQAIHNEWVRTVGRQAVTARLAERKPIRLRPGSETRPDPAT